MCYISITSFLLLSKSASCCFGKTYRKYRANKWLVVVNRAEFSDYMNHNLLLNNVL